MSGSGGLLSLDKTETAKNISTGKRVAHSSPVFNPASVEVKLPNNRFGREPSRLATELEMTPTIPGPKEQPISPARASSANMPVPPAGQYSAAREKEPGHMIPTDRPHRAQPARERSGIGDRVASR